MRIGRLFAVSMLSVTVLAVVLGAGVLVPQYRTFASKTEAIKAVEAYGTVLAVGQQVAGYFANNEALAEAPQALNEDPYGDGWICTIRMSDPAEFDRFWA